MSAPHKRSRAPRTIHSMKAHSKVKWHHPPTALFAVAGLVATGASKLSPEVDGFLAEMSERLIAPEAVAAAGIAVEATADVGIAAVSTLVILILIGVLLVLMLFLVLCILLKSFVNNVWIIGGPLSKFCDGYTHVMETIIHIVWHELELWLGDAMRSWRVAFDWFLHGADVATLAFVNAQIKGTKLLITQFENQISGLVGALDDAIFGPKTGLVVTTKRLVVEHRRVVHRITILEGDIHGIKVPSLNAVWKAIHHLQHLHGLSHGHITKLETKVIALEQKVLEQDREILHELRTLRTLEQRVFKIEKEVEQLQQAGTSTGGMTVQQRRQLATAYHFSTSLAPLTLLAPFTVFRIGNLRKLEDDPCQCPQTGGIGNPLIPVILADFIAKDGL